jgi:hypothetical protein
MRQDVFSGADALGLWDPESASIVIRRDPLTNLRDFAGTLLHEIAHARTGYPDVTREFEDALTTFLGSTAAAAVNSQHRPALAHQLFTRRKIVPGQ